MKILVVTSCFAPKNVIGAVRISKLVKYLVREGNEITVISPVLEQYDGIDSSLECDELAKVRRVLVPYSKITTLLTSKYMAKGNSLSSNNDQKTQKKSIKRRITKSLRASFNKYRNNEWGRKAKKQILGLKDDFDLVISSYPLETTHNVALYAKRTGKAKFWIADFRDPMVLDTDFGRNREEKSRRQSEIVRNADIVTYVLKNGLYTFVCYPEDRQKIRWIPNGFDEDDLEKNSDNNKNGNLESGTLNLVYTGGLYGGERDCTPLFRAVRELIQEEKITRDDVAVHYAGRDGQIIINQADKCDVGQIVQDHRVVSRSESVELQNSSDCVIVATTCYVDNGGAMTGKIFEPVMLRRPILLLVRGEGRNSEPGQFVKNLNAGLVYEESNERGDVQRIKKMILDMLVEKKANGYTISRMNEGEREEYNYKAIADKLICEVQNVKNYQKSL
jgi:hypothetical protein